MKNILFLLVSVLCGCVHQEEWKSVETEKIVESDENGNFWELSDVSIRKKCELASLEFEEKIAEIKSNKYGNIILNFEQALAVYSNKMAELSFFGYISFGSKAQEGMNCEKLERDIILKIYSDTSLYQLLVNVDGMKLSNLERRALNNHKNHFFSNGCHLDLKSKNEFIVLKNKINNKEIDFLQKWNEFSEILEFSPEELNGYDKELLLNFKKSTNAKIQFVLTENSYVEAMKHVKNANIRKKIYEKFFSKGGIENKKIMNEVVDLRSQCATILGKESHAQLIQMNSMAKNPILVKKFLKNLHNKIQTKYSIEMQNILDVKKKYLGKYSGVKLDPWDFYFFEEKILENKNIVQYDEIKNYFPLEQTLANMIALFEKSFKIKFVKNKDHKNWDKSVYFYDLYESENNKKFGSIYLDLFEREGKFKHSAATFALSNGYLDEKNQFTLPIASILMNLNSSKPVLLELDNVIHLFHEFAHAFHVVFTKVEYFSLSGSKVYRDFIETPGIVFEFWATEPKVLKRLSSHYIYNKPLEDKVLKEIIKNRTFSKATDLMVQLFYASIDLYFHELNSPTSEFQMEEIYLKLFREIRKIEPSREMIANSSFHHIMGNYDATYYAYLWSYVIAFELYSTFKEKGPMYFKEKILEKGNSEDPFILVKSYLGRELSLFKNNLNF